MVSEKGDVTSADTINRGYVWASTNTTTKSRSGSASADYNLIVIFGKNNINKSINLGFTVTIQVPLFLGRILILLD